MRNWNFNRASIFDDISFGSTNGQRLRWLLLETRWSCHTMPKLCIKCECDFHRASTVAMTMSYTFDSSLRRNGPWTIEHWTHTIQVRFNYPNASIQNLKYISQVKHKHIKLAFIWHLLTFYHTLNWQMVQWPATVFEKKKNQIKTAKKIVSNFTTRHFVSFASTAGFWVSSSESIERSATHKPSAFAIPAEKW